MLVATRFRRSLLVALALACLLALWIGLQPAPAHAQRAEPRAETTFAGAYKLYAERLYQHAAQAFETFRARYPDHINAPDALFFEAEATLAAGNEEHAVRLFNDFRRRYPSHPLAAQAQLALGQYFYETDAYEEGIEALQRVLANDPPPGVAARTLFWMGELSQQLHRYDDALAYYRRAADTYRHTDTAPTALYAVAYLHLQRKHYDEAARAFEQLAERHPNAPYARNLGLALGEAYFETASYGRAVDEIRRRLSQLDDETRLRATYLLAESYNQLRDSENAIVYYQRIVDQGPATPYYREALYGLGWNYYREGAYQWAAERFTEVRDSHDDALAEKATYYEAVALKQANRPREAIDRFERVADEWPGGDWADRALYELGLTQYELRRWEEAGEAFTRLIEQHEDSELLGDALRMRGYTAVALGDFDPALQDFDRAVALDAAPVALKQEVQFQKAWLLYRTGEYEEAAPAFLTLYEERGDTPEAGEALFWAAESYFQQGRLDRAADLFRQYRQAYPGGRHAEATHYALGWTHFKQARYDHAIDEFTRFLDAYRRDDGLVPYRTDARLRLADSYYALKRFNEAITTYMQVVDAGEDYALYQIGQAYYNNGDAFEAIATFEELLSEYPEGTYREEAQYSLGYIYFQNQDYDRAIEAYRDLIETYPRDPLAAKAQYGIGDALYNAERYAEAVEAYRTVLERYPESPFVADAATGIQYAFFALDDPEQASALVDSFAAAHPDSPVVDELRFRQAEVRLQNEDTDDAIAAFERFVETSQNRTLIVEAHYHLGVTYAEREDDERAASHLQAVLEQGTNTQRRPAAARRLGEIYLDQERYDDALTVYRQLEEMQPEVPHVVAEARYGQSRALLGMNRLDEARELLQHATEVAPDGPDALPAQLGLARIYEREGREEEARALYRRIVDDSQDETGAEALYRLGQMMLREGAAREAIEELSRMTALYAGYPEWLARGYLLEARAFRSLGQTGEAIRIYDRVINEFDGTPYARTAAEEKASLL